MNCFRRKEYLLELIKLVFEEPELLVIPKEASAEFGGVTVGVSSI